MFQHRLANIGFLIILVAGLLVTINNLFNTGLEIVAGVIALVGIILLVKGMYKGGELKK